MTLSVVRLICPSCSYALNAPESMVLRGVRCHRCGAHLIAGPPSPSPPPLLPAEKPAPAPRPAPWWAIVLAIAVPLLLLAGAVAAFVAAARR
jgi:hypothetical protein